MSKGNKILIGACSHWFVTWRKFQVRGVVIDVLDICILRCALFDWNCNFCHLFLHCLIGVFSIFPETAWRFIPYRQAAHQVCCAVLVLAWSAWRRWISARRRDTVRVLSSWFVILYVWEPLWVLKLIHIAFIGYLVDLKSVEIWGGGGVLGILGHELSQVILEGKDRVVYMDWFRGRKLVDYICIVIAWIM